MHFALFGVYRAENYGAVMSLLFDANLRDLSGFCWASRFSLNNSIDDFYNTLISKLSFYHVVYHLCRHFNVTFEFEPSSFDSLY